LHEELWFYHEGNRALRQGDWKLIHGNVKRPFPWGPSTEAATEKKQVAGLGSISFGEQTEQSSMIWQKSTPNASKPWQPAGPKWQTNS
jgi:arylsulfatase A-like enzyme